MFFIFILMSEFQVKPSHPFALMPKFVVKRNVTFKDCVLVWDGCNTCVFKAIKDEPTGTPNLYSGLRQLSCVNQNPERMEVEQLSGIEAMEFWARNGCAKVPRVGPHGRPENRPPSETDSENETRKTNHQIPPIHEHVLYRTIAQFPYVTNCLFCDSV